MTKIFSVQSLHSEGATLIESKTDMLWASAKSLDERGVLWNELQRTTLCDYENCVDACWYNCVDVFQIIVQTGHSGTKGPARWKIGQLAIWNTSTKVQRWTEENTSKIQLTIRFSKSKWVQWIRWVQWISLIKCLTEQHIHWTCNDNFYTNRKL